MANQSGVGKLLVSSTTIARSFELANRRVSQLSPASQVLCAVIMAIGARCSDHPALIGAGAPRTAELGAAARAGIDLRSFGRRRQDASRALFTRALELADRSGTLRDPSLESMAALVLIEGLVEETDHLHSEARPYTNAYTGHGRVMLEDGPAAGDRSQDAKLTLSGSVLGWTAYVRDAFTAANQGRAPNFSEDDKFLLSGRGERTPLPLELALAPVHPPPSTPDEVQENFWQLFNSM